MQIVVDWASQNWLLILLLWLPFAVTLAVLKFVLIDPMREWLDGRHQAIDGERQRAEQLKHEAEKAVVDVEAKLAAARDEAARLRAEFKARGQKAEAAALAVARQQADAELSRALAEISAEARDARANIGAVATQLSTEIAGRALGRAISA